SRSPRHSKSSRSRSFSSTRSSSRTSTLPRISLRLLEPGREEHLYLTAALRKLEPRAHRPVLDHDERRHVLDREPLEELGPLLLRDRHESEGLVVVPALEHLGEEPLDAATATRGVGIEERQPQILRRADVRDTLSDPRCH